MKYKYDLNNKNHDKIIYKSILFLLDFILFDKLNGIRIIDFIIKENRGKISFKKEELEKIKNNLFYYSNLNDENNINLKDEEKKEIIDFLSNLYILLLNSDILIDIGKQKLLMGEKKIVIKNEIIEFHKELISKKDIEKKIKYILNKKEQNKNKEIKEKNITFANLLEEKKEKKEYNLEKDLELITERIKNIFENENISDYLSTLLMFREENKNKFKSIIFYDLETLITTKEVVAGALVGINLNRKKSTFRGPEVFIILLYNDISELFEYNRLYKNIFKTLQKKVNFKLRKLSKENKIGLYFMEMKQFINLYKKRIEQDTEIPILSGFNIIGFDNPVLFKEKELVNKANKYSVDLFEFLTKVNDKGELNLIAKNNGFGTKLMTHEELLQYLSKDYLNNPKNFSGISKMILYNVVDTLLTVELFDKFIKHLKKGEDIIGATKMISSEKFKRYIGEKIIK